MKDKALIDIFGWDTVNWSQAVPLWEKYLAKYNTEKVDALELGGGVNGGLSLWLALKGIKTFCTGYNPDNKDAFRDAKQVHKKYNVSNIVEYKSLDATNIPFKSEFDIICYKSMLGGIVRNKGLDIAQHVTNEIYSALKPGGVLLFAENLTSTIIHRFLRRNYGAGKNDWRYFSTVELKSLHSKFEVFEYRTYGFLGCFGQNEKQRLKLGYFDKAIQGFLPNNWNYIFIGVAVKGGK